VLPALAPAIFGTVSPLVERAPELLAPAAQCATPVRGIFEYATGGKRVGQVGPQLVVPIGFENAASESASS
jgi:hypothetical protein